MAFDASRVRALIFDVDGTLSDTDDVWVNRSVRLLAPVRFLFARRDAVPFARRVLMGMDAPGNAIYALLDRLNLDAPLARLSDTVRGKNKPTPRGGFKLVPGTIEMLERLHGRFQLGIATARDQTTTNEFLTQFNLTPYFGAVASALTCAHSKPYPDQVLWTAKQLGIEPAACVMIGDTVVDMRAGRAAGAQTVGVLCGFGSENELAHAGADLILPSPMELVNLFG